MNDSAPAQTFAGAVGSNLARIRSAKGLSQEELGFRAGLHRTAIGDLERGENIPRLDSAMKMAAVLDVPLEALTEGIGWNSPVLAAGGFAFAEPKQTK
jgi:XRE family transcriptional regulator, regulator of sulfur utilization